MKVTLPESINDITLDQYQRYILLSKREGLDDFQFNQRKIAIFTNLKTQEVVNVKKKDIDDMIIQIDKALNQTVEFKNRFFIDDVEFGFVPNLDKMTGGEFADLSKYGTDIENLHYVMAILFRPITKFDSFKNYKIDIYRGTEGMTEIMKLMPLSVVNGALVFFSNLSNELLNYIQRYTAEELAKENPHRTILSNGDGMQPSMN